MIRKILIPIFLAILISVISIQIDRVTTPKRGEILRYENFRGFNVPIIADGSRGYYRWLGDVPWDVFTIEEKIDFARNKGGFLNESDIEEIRTKYTKR